MPSPSLITAAKRAPDARVQILRMAELMRHHKEGIGESCTALHLYQAGFTEAEVIAYRDDARAALRGKPSANRWTPPDRLKGMLLVKKAREIQERNGRRRWAAPVVRVADEIPEEAFS